MVERDFQMATFIGTGRPVSKAALPVNWDIKIGKYFLTLKICISPIIMDIKIGQIFAARKRCVIAYHQPYHTSQSHAKKDIFVERMLLSFLLLLSSSLMPSRI